MMKIYYSEQVKKQLNGIKEYIAKDNRNIATKYLLKIKEKIELIGKYPYIGKINSTRGLCDVYWIGLFLAGRSQAHCSPMHPEALR